MSDRRPIYLCALAAVVAVVASTGLRAQTGVPGIPTDLQVSATGNRVTATWAAPLTGGPPITYVVIARNAGGATVVEQPVGGVTTVSGDVPAGVYFVSVRADNLAGAGPETAPRIVSVAVAGAPGTPTGVTVTGLGNVLRIQWDAPVTGGTVTNYVVTVRNNTSGEVSRVNAGPGTTLILPRRDGSYSLAVQASNGDGTSPESIAAAATVPLAGPAAAAAPGMPANFTVNVSGNVLSLSWSPPTAGAAPTAYLALLRDATGTVVTVYDLGNTLSFVGSVPNGVYPVSVVAMNAAGGGPPTAVQTATVPSGTIVPGAPSLVGTVAGSTVRFSWTPAPGAAASQFRVRATTTPGGPVIATLDVTGQTTEVSVDDVPPGQYFATVTAANTFGEGPPSNTVAVVVAGAAVSRSTLNAGLGGNLDYRFSQTSSASRVFDDFVLGPGAVIGTIAWQGAYCTQTNDAPVPSPSASAFVISLHADNNGRPSTTQALATATVPLAQVNQTFAGSRTITCGNSTNAGSAYYNYSVTLPNPVAIQGGVRYWLAIQAVNSSTGASWGWRSGTVDTRSTYQLSNGTLTRFDNDRAFALTP